MTDTPAITKEARRAALQYAAHAISLTRSTVNGFTLPQPIEWILEYEALVKELEVENAALQEENKYLKAIRAALDEQDWLSNPDHMEAVAREIDCEGSCEHIWREYDTNSAGCRLSEKGGYCPWELAELLRSVAKVERARAALGEKE